MAIGEALVVGAVRKLSLAAVASGLIAVMLCAAAQAQGAAPIAAYSFDEGEGSTLHDSVGDHDGAIEGAEWTTGKYGGALEFDGEDDLVSIADAADLDLTGSFTLEAWVDPDVQEDDVAVLSKLNGAGEASAGYALFAQNINAEEDEPGVPAGLTGDGGAEAAVESETGSLPRAYWSHVALTSDGETLRLYVDGEEVGSTTAVSAEATEAALQIGRNQISGKHFDGLIDELRIYDEALDQAQIGSDRRSAVGLASDPIAAYSFDEGEGSALGDSAGEHNGTVEGAEWTTEGKYGGALSFDGEDDLVSVADAAELDLTGSFTLEAWVRPDEGLLNGTAIASKLQAPGSGLEGYLLTPKTFNKPAGIVADGTTSKAAIGEEALPVESWSHVALTSDGETLRLYIDGEQIGSSAAVSAKATEAALQIGRNQSSGKHFDGLIDELRIYDRALDGVQIRFDEARAIDSDTLEPIAAYSFDEGEGSALGDSAGEHDGTVEGAEWTAEGRYGGALSFDGEDDLVSVADAAELDLTGSFTLEAWVKPGAGIQKNGVAVLSKARDETGLEGYLLNAQTLNRPAGIVADGEASAAALGEDPLLIDEWSHLAFVSDGTTARLYVNGSEVRSTAALDVKATEAALEIGHHQTSGKHFEGLIDEVRVYDGAIDARQIAADLDEPVTDLGGVFATDPPLYPAFDPGISDYIVRCDGQPVDVSAEAQSGATIAIDGGEPAGGSSSAEVGLEAGQAFGVAIEREEVAREHHVRCVGEQFPAWNYDRLGQASHRFYITAPGTPANKLVIFDDNGAPVWWYGSAEGPKAGWDTKVLPEGNVLWSSPGSSRVTDLDGDTLHTLQTKFGNDPHDVQQLPNGNFLLMAYRVRRDAEGEFELVDLTSIGLGEAMKVIDAEIEEVDPETGETVWSWNSKDHIAPEEMTSSWRAQLPVAAYSFDEGEGTTLSDDVSAYDDTVEHNGTIEGATWTSGKDGGALEFDGEDDLVSIADHAELDLSEEFTIEAWVNPAEEAGGSQPVLSKYAGGDGYLLKAKGASGPVGQVYSGGVGQSAESPEALPAGEWSHVALVFDGADLQLYVDGESVDGPTAFPAGLNSADLQIGHDQSSPTDYFAGKIDDLRIYDEALDETLVRGDLEEEVEFKGGLPIELTHLNSIEPTPDDGLILSMRYPDAVYKIDRSTGDVVWKLGGTQTEESLEVLEDPVIEAQEAAEEEVSPLGGQHDARLQPDGTVTIFDNASFIATPSRGVRYSIDEEAMTATHLESYLEREATRAKGCCGSARRSADGSWMVSWGNNVLITEARSNGDRTFRLTFGPSTQASLYRASFVPSDTVTIDDLRAGMDAMYPR